MISVKSRHKVTQIASGELLNEKNIAGKRLCLCVELKIPLSRTITFRKDISKTITTSPSCF